MERSFVPWTLMVFSLIYHIGEGLASLRRFLATRDNKQISSDTLAELVEVVLKNNIFEFDEKTFKQKRGTEIGPKLHLFMLFFL